MSVVIERIAMATAVALPARVKFWATTLLLGAYIDEHGPHAGYRVSVTDLLLWADEPSARLGGKGNLDKIMNLVKDVGSENRILRKEIERLQRIQQNQDGPKTT